MQLPRSIGVGLSMAVLLAACSGGPGTTGPAGATTNPGGGPTANAGGGGSGGGGTGKVTYTVTGDVQKNGELPFFAFGSRFGGEAGVALHFTTEQEGGAIFSLSELAGVHSISLLDEEHGLSWGECETFELNITGNNATGRFDCSKGFGTVSADGSVLQALHIVGTFDAHG